MPRIHQPPTLTCFFPLLAFLLALAVPATAQVVTIEDPSLELVIRQKLNKVAGYLMVEDMESLTTLDSREYVGPPLQIESLEGLQAAANLTALVLAGDVGNALQDFTPLVPLSKLTTLDLQNSVLTSIEFPPGLSNIRFLWLDGNIHLTNITFSSGMTDLRLLQLGGSRITELELAPDMSKLAILDLVFHQSLKTLTLHSGLTSLRTARLRWGGLTNLTLEPGLEALEFLDVGHNRLTSLTVPGHLHNLTSLFVVYNFKLTNVTIEAGLSNLTTLEVIGAFVDSLSLPNDLVSLTSLFVQGETGFTNFNTPPGFVNLTTLTAQGFWLTNVTIPKELTKLSSIDLQGVQLTTLNLPKELMELTTLNLRLTEIVSLDVPPELNKLANLSVLQTPITNLTMPAGIPVNPHVKTLRILGAEVTLYPRMRRPFVDVSRPIDILTFEVFVDTGIYTIERSPTPDDPASWTDIWTITNTSANFPGHTILDTTFNTLDKGFYRISQ